MQTVVNRFRQFLSANWCFIGVIVFFIFHGYVDNENVVPFTSLLPLFAELLGAGLVLFFISRLLFRENTKANVYTAIVLIIVLFFGVIQDYLSQFRILTSISRYRVFIPLSFLLMVIAFIWLKRMNQPLKKMVLFLNTLLVIYFLVDVGTLVKSNFFTASHPHPLTKYKLSGCDTCAKPPVYLLLFDSYFGSQGLKEFFHYDNTRFEQALTSQGFHIAEASHSNYKFTVYSMASLLNMDYLSGIGEPVFENHYAFTTAVSTIKKNAVCQYFSNLGYKINNNSIFDLHDIPAGYSSGVLPEKVQLITSQTLYYRLSKHLPFFLAVAGLRSSGTNDDVEASFIRNRKKAMEQTLSYSRSTDSTPAFTYLHILMPHLPFIQDSLGHPSGFLQKKDLLPQDSIDNMFLQYEVYANKVILPFISRLKQETGGKAVILLMSDHGYQEARGDNKKLPFINLNAVYLPENNYQGWYKGISNVNQFRVLFNTLFHQQLPLLSDSIVIR